MARKLYWTAFDFKTHVVINPKNLQESSRILRKFTNSVKENYPFNYYITSKFVLLYKFLNQKKGLNTRAIKYPLNVGFAFTEAFNARALFFGGIIAVIFLCITNIRNS